jgi:hypothetical protein
LTSTEFCFLLAVPTNPSEYVTRIASRMNAKDKIRGRILHHENDFLFIV